MNGQEVLREAIRTIPIPGSPPTLSEDAAMVGLAFLDAGLRQHHIRRLTERFHIVRHGVGSRVTEVDINLGMLSQEQRDASYLLHSISMRSEPAGRYAYPPSTPPDIWVPVARLSRRGVSPVEVMGQDGSRLPRLTQYETSRLLVAAMIRLLRGILRSLPDARADTQLGKFLHTVDEARWLLQSAIATVLLEKSRPKSPTLLAPRADQVVDGHGAQYRSMVMDILSHYTAELRDFMALLDVAVREYLLVVGLHGTHDEHILRYSSPLTAMPVESRIRHPWELLYPKTTDYHVVYRTQIPTTLRSYHLVTETEQEVSVQGIVLVTNAEQRAISELAQDLRHLAEKLPSEPGVIVSPARRKTLELELQAALRQVAELYRRRTWEADEVGLAIDENQIKHIRLLASATMRGDATTSDDGQINNSLLRHPIVTSDSLRSCADEIEASRLWLDLSVQRDPAVSTAHAYWRRSSHVKPGGAVMSFTAAITLRDSGSTRPRGIILYLLGIALMSYIMGSIVVSAPLPMSGVNRVAGTSSDAIVAVLLLVPGFLFTRLDLPAPKSIVGRLRTRSRLAAYACIALAALEAAVIAGGIEGRALANVFSIATLLLLLLTLWLYVVGPAKPSPLVIAQDGLPQWISHGPVVTPAERADVVFRSSEIAS